MSGTVNANIPLSFQPTPNVGPNFGKAISDANNLVQLQQFKQQVERANKLRDILGAPDAIDPATGMPKTDTISKAMAVDPQAGMKLGEYAVNRQTQQLNVNAARSKASAEQAQRLNDALSPIVLQHEEAIKSGKVTPQQADAASQKAWTEAREELVNGGLPPDVAQHIPTQWNYQDAKRRAMASDVYLTNLKNQRDQAKEGQTEKHQTTQEQIERERIAASERAGRWVSGFGNDTEGKSVPGMYFTPKDGGEPVFHPGVIEAPKGGAKSAANQDRDAITNVVRSDYEKELGRPVNLADPNEKAELDRRTLAAEDKRAADRAGATTGARVAAQQAAGKPMPVTVNGVRQDALFHDGKYWNLDGTPMEGKVLGVSRAEGKKTPGQAAEEDAMAVADKRIAALEEKRGTPLDQAERAEQRQIARADPKIQETARKQDANAIDDDSAKLIAEESLRGDWHGTVGMGRNQASMRKIAEWRGKLAKEQGLSGADLAANTAEFMGILAAERVLGTRGAGIDLGIAEAGKFAPMVLRASDMVDRTKFPTVNSLLLAAEKGTGGEAVIRLIDSLNAYKMAYTQILTRGGMPTDDSRRRADEVIDKAWSNGQIKTALDQLNQEMNGARSAVPEVRDNLYKALTGKSRTSPVDQVPSPVDRAHQSQPTQGQQQWPIPNQKAIDAAKSDSKLRTQFEGAFGPGSLSKHGVQGAPAAAPQAAPAQPPPAPSAPAPAQPATPPARAAAPVQTKGTAAAPLPLPKIEADLVDGGIYASDKGVVRFDKEKKRFFPVGGQ